MGLPGLNVTSQVIESLVLLLSPPLASAQLSFRKRLRKEATDLPELLEFLAVMHSRPLLAWRYSAYSNHDVFVPVQASSILEQSGGNKEAFLIDSTPYSGGLYEIGVGIAREANPNYCCESCDGPSGPLLDEPTGYYVGWDIGTLISIGTLSDGGVAQLESCIESLTPSMDLELTLSTLSRPALLAFFGHSR